MSYLEQKIEKLMEGLSIHEQRVFMDGYRAGFDEAKETAMGVFFPEKKETVKRIPTDKEIELLHDAGVQYGKGHY